MHFILFLNIFEYIISKFTMTVNVTKTVVSFQTMNFVIAVIDGLASIFRF